jgi:predicted ATPase
MDIALISDAAVARTLRSVLARDVRPDDPLLAMAMVSERLSSYGAAATPEAMRWALADALQELVRARLDGLRGDAGPALAPGVAPEVAIAGLLADFGSGERDREAWSAIYYHYLARHELQVKEIAALVRPGSSTARRFVGRRLHDGVALLAHELRAHECAARRLSADRPGPLAAVPELLLHHPHLVPRWRTALIGRDDEVSSAAAEFAAGTILTIVGPPGVGKTRFAAEVATAAAHRFPDGVVFLDLTRVDNWEALPAMLAEAFGIPDDADRSVAATVLQAMGCRPVLLFLDNCEHVLSMSARFADELSGACSRIGIVATSREPLHIEGECVWRLSGLALPEEDTGSIAADLTRFGATRLFIERARAADRSFQVTEVNAASIIHICRRLEGLPLAIELVAARVGAIPVDVLADRIDDALSFTSTIQRLPARGPETLRETILWSHRLLTPAQQGLFCRLAAFADSWSLPAAEAVCAGDIVPAELLLGHFAALVDKSLVVLATETPELRYRFIEPVRHVARELLNQCPCLVPTRDRYIDYYVGLAERAEAALHGPDRQRWLALLQAERDNFGAAIRRSRKKPDIAAGLRIASALSGYCVLSGRIGDCRRMVEDQLALTGPDVDPAVVAKAYLAAAALAREQGDVEAAELFTERVAALGERPRRRGR